MNRKRLTLVVGCLLAVFGLAIGGTAYAVTSSARVSVARTGTFTDKQQFAHSTDAFSSNNAAAWVTVPNSAVTVVVPANTRRMLDARFSAESVCTGGSWCSARIAYQQVAPAVGPVIEFDGQASTDFAFDSPSAANGWESLSMERTTPFLAAGTYRVLVQLRSVGAATHRVDDRTLAVESIRP